MSDTTKILTEEAGRILANKIQANQSSITTINTALDRLNGAGEGSVSQQIAEAMDGFTATGGGAIPAYIVGDTMTRGWLSKTDGGSAFVPVDKQEYIILSSGDWLRKHVMWFEDLEVYRLTGKVGIVSNVQREIIIDAGTKSQTLNGSGYSQTPYNADNVNANELTATYTANNVLLNLGGTVRFVFDYRVEVNRNIFVKFGDVILDTLTSSGTSTNKGRYNKTFTVKPEHIGKRPAIERAIRNDSFTYRFSGVAGIEVTYNYVDDYTDYETDDIIDITEAEVEQLWGETGGMPNPNNNVMSLEKRLWGYYIDGKPIYRKTIVTTMPSAVNSEKKVDIGATIETVVNFEAVITLKDGVNDGVNMTLTGTTDTFTGFGKVKVYDNTNADGNKIGILTSANGWVDQKVVVTVYFTEAV